MNGFDDPHWNTVQLFSWICFGDRALVARASERHGRDNRFCSVAHIGTLSALERMKGKPALSVGEALDDALRRLQSGQLTGEGRENGTDEIKPIPRHQWADLTIEYDPNCAVAPRHRKGQHHSLLTYWTDLRFEQFQVLKIWPDPFVAQEPQDQDEQPTRSGFAGRPPMLRAKINAEFERRVKEGRIEPTLAGEARALSSWAKAEFPDQDTPKPGTIENVIRERYRLKPTTSSLTK